ncbi:Rqc2 family fibronectin-binding protein [Thermovibrio ammonificans]|jgi:predicted ribosome quality control (RQC) complex YloA/Tae2 family protein
MDYLFIEKLSGELNRLLRKGKIREVRVEGNLVSVGVGKLWLNLYFGNPNAAFVSEEPKAKRGTRKLPVEGSFIKSVNLPTTDRVLEIELVKLSLSGQPTVSYLVIELTGKNANFFVLNGERRIIYQLKEVKSSVRPLKPGELYQLPPNDKKPFEELKFGEVTPKGVEKKLYKFVAGLSPLNAKEIAHIFKETKKLTVAYATFMEKHAKSDKSYLYYQNGKPKFMTTFRYGSLEGLPFKEFSGHTPYSDCWRTFFEEAVEERELENLKREILKRLAKREKALREELREYENPEKIEAEALKAKKLGELLKYNLHLVKPGSRKAHVTDYETGETVTVELDPALSPRQNLENYFKKYRKLSRKLQRAKETAQKLKTELLLVSLLKERVEKAENREELLLLEQPQKEKSSKGLPIAAYTLPSGRKLLVGKNSSGNELLLRLASPHDYWFHAREVPGSHVILKVERGKEPSEEELLTAASAAAYFSKGRESGKVKVDFTKVKYVRKPPGTRKGFVTYKNETTVTVTPEKFEREVLKGKAPEGGRN